MPTRGQKGAVSVLGLMLVFYAAYAFARTGLQYSGLLYSVPASIGGILLVFVGIALPSSSPSAKAVVQPTVQQMKSPELYRSDVSKYANCPRCGRVVFRSARLGDSCGSLFTSSD